MTDGGLDYITEHYIARELLTERVSPFEIAYRGFLEANAALLGVNATLEREAKRVARLLHDGAGQTLFALQLAVAELDRELPPRLRPVLEEIQSLTGQLDDQLHQHSRELYPVILEDLGLAAALGQLLERLEKRSDLAVVFKCSLEHRPPPAIESAVYRATQEAITNVKKHARATRISVSLSESHRILRCAIADNGVGGVTPQPVPGGRRGLGLSSIRERMKLVRGTVDIRSRSGQGTEVILRVPLPGATGEADR